MIEHTLAPFLVSLEGAIVTHWASVIATSVRFSSFSPLPPPRVCSDPYQSYGRPSSMRSLDVYISSSSTRRRIPGTQVCRNFARSLRISLVCSRVDQLEDWCSGLGVTLTICRIRGRWPWAVENMIREYGKEIPVGFPVLG